MRAVDPAKSRIVMVGAPAYDDPQLPPLPQIRRNLTDLAAVFTDPAVGGFPPEHCVVADPGRAGRIAMMITDPGSRAHALARLAQLVAEAPTSPKREL